MGVLKPFQKSLPFGYHGYGKRDHQFERSHYRAKAGTIDLFAGVLVAVERQSADEQGSTTNTFISDCEYHSFNWNDEFDGGGV